MNAQQLRNSILQEAIEGRLVPQDPNDEPASILLDRIRKEKEILVKEGKLKKKDLIETPITEEEIPFEVPESWEWVRLGYLINLLSGRDLSPTEYNKSNNGIPYMTGASNFESGILIVNRWTNHPATISHKGDLLITCK
jgi:type I restriction enzyme S subunit